MIIGLCGYARSGKNSVADVLARSYGFKTVAFADKMREGLLALNPGVPIDINSQDRFGLGTHARLRDLVLKLGWDDAKSIYEVRELLQRFGTDAGRNVLGENIWVDALLNDCLIHQNYSVADVRFPNEATAIRERGGIIVRVMRPGVTAVNAHISEKALDNFVEDARIVNDGSLDDLNVKVREIMAALVVDA